MVEIDTNKCIGCGMCVRDCLPESLELSGGKAHFLKDHNCMQCGHCIAICPRAAVSIPDLDMEEVTPIKDLPHKLDPETFMGHIRARRSIRAFGQEEVSSYQLGMLINTGRFSPTGGNRQNVRYNVFRERLSELRELVLKELDDMAASGKGDSWYPELWQDMYRSYQESGTDRLFFGAGTVILVSSDSPQAACIAAAHMETMANALDLGVLYSGFTVRAISASEELRRMIDLPDGYTVWAALVVGKPLVTYKRTVPRNPAVVILE